MLSIPSMGLAGIFISSFIIAFSGAMMPGPMFTATMFMSSKRGFLAGPVIVMGHGTLEAVLVVLLYLGFGSLFQNHAVMGSIGILGGLALVWMAYEAFRAAPYGEGSGNGTHNGPGEVLSSRTGAGGLLDGSAYVAGIVTSLSNPYWVVWWATIGLSYIVLSFRYGITGIMIFYAGHILADLVWYTVVALTFGSMKRFVSSKGSRVIAVISGIIFVCFSAYFLWYGISSFVKS